jgi:hypothetical protein
MTAPGAKGQSGHLDITDALIVVQSNDRAVADDHRRSIRSRPVGHKAESRWIIMCERSVQVRGGPDNLHFSQVYTGVGQDQSLINGIAVE